MTLLGYLEEVLNFLAMMSVGSQGYAQNRKTATRQEEQQK